MKRLLKYTLGILTFFLLCTCQKDDPTNPFDPDTPKSIWTPTNFTATQNNNSVNLTWVQNEKNIDGFKIDRKVGSQDWNNVKTLQKTATSWTDNNLTGGERHQYRLYAYAGDNHSNEVTIEITPLITATVNILPATNIEPNSATINGNVNANGSSTTVTFLYKSGSSSDWISVDANPKTVTGNTQTTVKADLSELSPGEEYTFKIKATNSSGELTSGELTFNTSCNPPTASLSETTNLEQTSVTLNGKVSANGASTQVKFEYGETTNYGTSVAASPETVTENNEDVSVTLTNLNPDTKYYYKIVATNCGGTVEKESSFTTVTDCVQPTIGTLSTSDITVNSVTLKGQVNPNGKSTTVIFEYGTTTNYGKTVTASNSPISGTSLTNVNASVSGLQSCTKYYFRIKAENCGGTATSSSSSFTTTGIEPTATTLAATNITQNSATLNAQVNANGSPTTVTFVYESSLWMPGDPINTIEATPSTVTGTNTVDVSADITGLYAGLLYRYYVVAENCDGRITGFNKDFTTTEATSGTFTDSRDNRTYKWVKIGEQIWMAENLAYEGWPYNQEENNREIYGSLYNDPDDWPYGPKCPEGWHVPTDNEWKELETTIGLSSGELDNTGWRGTNEGAKLKAVSGWDNNGNGTDDYKFTALPAGYHNKFFEFLGLGTSTSWWTATLYSSWDYNSYYIRSLKSDSNMINRTTAEDYYGFSIRCVKD